MLCYCPLCADLIPKAGSLPWYQGLTPKGVGKRTWRVSSFLVRAWRGRCINWFCLNLIGQNWLKGNTHVNGMLENLVPRWAHQKPQRAFLWRKRRGEWVLGKISYLCLSVCVQSFIREGPCGLSQFITWLKQKEAMSLNAVYHCKCLKTDSVSTGCWKVTCTPFPSFSEEYMGIKDIYSNWNWHN